MNQPYSGPDRRGGEESPPPELNGRHSAAGVEPTTVVPLGSSGRDDDAQPAGSAGTEVISTASVDAVRTDAVRTGVATGLPGGDGATQVVSTPPAGEAGVPEQAPQAQFGQFPNAYAPNAYAPNPQSPFGPPSYMPPGQSPALGPVWNGSGPGQWQSGYPSPDGYAGYPSGNVRPSTVPRPTPAKAFGASPVVGIVAVVFFVVGNFAVTLGANWAGQQYSFDDWQWALMRMLWVLPYLVAALCVGLAVNTRLRTRTGTVLLALGSVAVMFVWNLVLAIGFWTEAVADVTSSWFRFPVFAGIAMTLMVAAWYRARRTSSLTLVLAPVAGVVTAVTYWLLVGVTRSSSPTPVSVALMNLWSYTLPAVVIAVVFAWLGVLLDKLVGGRVPAGSAQ
ncbi:MAG: hypothetical protein QM658_02300 [Gordonia sp. (in: high G+C Gram-positive bacteria)]